MDATDDATPEVADELRLDGNAAGGLLAELFAFEVTTAHTVCAACGAGGRWGPCWSTPTAWAPIIRCPYVRPRPHPRRPGPPGDRLDLRGLAVPRPVPGAPGAPGRPGARRARPPRALAAAGVAPPALDPQRLCGGHGGASAGRAGDGALAGHGPGDGPADGARAADVPALAAVGEAPGAGPGQLGEAYYVALLRFLGCTADAHETAPWPSAGTRSRSAPCARVGRAGADFLGRAVAARSRPGGSAARGPWAGSWSTPRGSGRRGALRAGRAPRPPPGARAGGARAWPTRWSGGTAAACPPAWPARRAELPARIVCLARDVEVLHAGPPGRTRSARSCAGPAGPPRPRGRGRVRAASAGARSRIPRGPRRRSIWERVWPPSPSLGSASARPGSTASSRCSPTSSTSSRPSRSGTRGAWRARRRAAPAGLGRGPGGGVCAGRGWCTTWGGSACRTGVGQARPALGRRVGTRVRLHSYYTERILARAPALAPLAATAGLHHERLDGSGYHRGRRPSSARAPARRGRRLPGHDPAPPPPPGARAGRGRRRGVRGEVAAGR